MRQVNPLPRRQRLALGSSLPDADAASPDGNIHVGTMLLLVVPEAKGSGAHAGHADRDDEQVAVVLRRPS
jgi:hypothetical protein